jgi:hypothetical protein
MRARNCRSCFKQEELSESNHRFPKLLARTSGLQPLALCGSPPPLSTTVRRSWRGIIIITPAGLARSQIRAVRPVRIKPCFFCPPPDTDSAGDTSSFEFLDRLLFVRLAPGEGPRALDKEEGEPLEAPCPAATPQVSLSLNTTRSHHREAALAAGPSCPLYCASHPRFNPVTLLRHQRRCCSRHNGVGQYLLRSVVLLVFGNLIVIVAKHEKPDGR